MFPRPSSTLNKAAPFTYVLLSIFACLLLLYLNGIYHPVSVLLTGFNGKGVVGHHNQNNTNSPADVYSLTTPDRKFFPLRFSDKLAYNPNILPHPTRQDQWLVIAQQEKFRRVDDWDLYELTCAMEFVDNALVCTATPTILPVQPGVRGDCETERLAMFGLLQGPHDARMFYGPDAPYIMYGSRSNHGCMGLWIQDARMLISDFQPGYSDSTQPFYNATEVGRPPPQHDVEKNFFLFWDAQGESYAHAELHVERVFGKLSMSDGTVGLDLARQVASKDNSCLTRYLPKIEPGAPESIHQATNSLTITLCKRTDDECVPTDDNTFIMTIIQHKSYYNFHSRYEPYVVLFQRRAPFALYAISTKPIWIHGRGRLTKDTHANRYEGRPDDIPQDHTEMFYVTSMSWKGHDQKYHGFIDDPLFLAFGIEDTRAGAIDILGGDLLQDLGSCTT
ncbi:hypothetical protein EDD37DRAFT_659548 [Exophiala viscosa]|uniref:uncharacterized protein n=1 Tax=Exophiala viscosa TaxID=2486360 RepID=UPI0021A00EFB|nr:hypothetical protein EDD37DRAFT_659548 [Exophiala viscosa]